MGISNYAMVSITGEMRAVKEAVAKGIHYYSARREGYTACREKDERKFKWKKDRAAISEWVKSLFP